MEVENRVEMILFCHLISFNFLYVLDSAAHTYSITAWTSLNKDVGTLVCYHEARVPNTYKRLFLLPLSSDYLPRPRDHLFFATTTDPVPPYRSLIYTHNHTVLPPIRVTLPSIDRGFYGDRDTPLLYLSFPILAVEFSFMRKRKHKSDHHQIISHDHFCSSSLTHCLLSL